MKKLYISSQAPSTVTAMLNNIGFDIIKLPCDNSLPPPVAHHADMLMFSDNVHLITTKSYYSKNEEIFNDVDVILSKCEFGNSYPDDIIFNAFVFKNKLFGRIDVLCDKVRCLYPKHVNLRQGYAKCSTLLFGNNAITADSTIANALINEGCNVLEIVPGNILLPGYNYGFIGGASTVYENKVIFFGNIELHPDFSKIKEHITSNGYDLIYEKNTPLTDIGGAIIINN